MPTLIGIWSIINMQGPRQVGSKGYKVLIQNDLPSIAARGHGT